MMKGPVFQQEIRAQSLKPNTILYEFKVPFEQGEGSKSRKKNRAESEKPYE
jgi:hypothetical protein